MNIPWEQDLPAEQHTDEESERDRRFEETRRHAERVIQRAEYWNRRAQRISWEDILIRNFRSGDRR
jgi:hypothetical protein